MTIRALAMAAVLLGAAASPAQTFSSSAVATLTAQAGINSQTFGPAAVVGIAFAGASCCAPYWSSASSNAVLTANNLRTSAGSIVPAFGVGASASADVTLTLQAPVGAGVRIALTHTTAHAFAWGPAAVTVAGQTYSSNTPGTQVFEVLVPAGGLNVQVVVGPVSGNSGATVDLVWDYPGVTLAGAPTPGCLGPAVCWTRGIPDLGNATFGFTCANTHPGLGGVVAIGLGGVTTPWVYDFVNIWLDPNLPIVTNYVPSNAAGDVFHGLPIPSHPSFGGLHLYGQWVLLEPPGCMPLDVSGSNAVRVVLQ